MALKAPATRHTRKLANAAIAFPRYFRFACQSASIQAGIRAREVKLSFLRAIVFPGGSPSDLLMAQTLTHRCGGSTGLE